VKLFSVIALAVLSGAAYAGPNGPVKIPECQAPFAACLKAGYVVGAHQKGDKQGTDKGLWVDCMHAVADGKKTVDGVDKSAAQACEAAKKAKRGR
jgi:hypothetical protein